MVTPPFLGERRDLGDTPKPPAASCCTSEERVVEGAAFRSPNLWWAREAMVTPLVLILGGEERDLGTPPVPRQETCTADSPAFARERVKVKVQMVQIVSH